MGTGFDQGKFDDAVFDDKEKMDKGKTILSTIIDKSIIMLKSRNKAILSTKKNDKIIL